MALFGFRRDRAPNARDLRSGELPYADALFGTALRLAELDPAPDLPQLDTCRALAPLGRRMGRELTLVARDRVRTGGILESFLAYLNLFLFY